MKTVDHKFTNNVIILRKIESSFELRNDAGVGTLQYYQTNVSPPIEALSINESLIEQSDSLLSNNSISSLFSDPSDLEDVLGVLQKINSNDIKTMFK